MTTTSAQAVDFWRALYAGTRGVLWADIGLCDLGAARNRAGDCLLEREIYIYRVREGERYIAYLGS